MVVADDGLYLSGQIHLIQIPVMGQAGSCLIRRHWSRTGCAPLGLKKLPSLIRLSSLSRSRAGLRMPESWDPIVYRERAEAWRQRAALLPQDDPQTAICLEIADGYARLAQLIEAERERLQSPP